MARREPEQFLVLRRAGHHEVLAPDTVAEGVQHQLGDARHVYSRVGVGAGREPASGLVGLFSEIDFAGDPRDGQRVLERRKVLRETRRVEHMERPLHGMGDVSQ